MAQELLFDLEFAVVVTDPREKDNPILYASNGFLRLTGYSWEEVVGRNCRFLQGPATERRHIGEIRDAIREDRSCQATKPPVTVLLGAVLQVCLRNYRKNGDQFWNQLYLEPIFDASGKAVRYVGIQADVSHLVNRKKNEEFGEIVSLEEREAKEVTQRLSGSEPPLQFSERLEREVEDGKLGETDRDTCSVLPSSILVALDQIQQSFVLVDPHLPDMPIVHAGDAFIALTGYPKDQIVGRNCRFLQGAETDAAEVARIRAAVTADPPRSVTATMLNYRYDGTPFWNALHIAPVRNADGHVAYLVGVQLNANQLQEGVEPLDKIPLPDVAVPLRRQGRRIPYCREVGFKQTILQSGTVGEVRMAIRSLSGAHGGLRRSLGDTDDAEKSFLTKKA